MAQTQGNSYGATKPVQPPPLLAPTLGAYPASPPNTWCRKISPPRRSASPVPQVTCQTQVDEQHRRTYLDAMTGRPVQAFAPPMAAALTIPLPSPPGLPSAPTPIATIAVPPARSSSDSASQSLSSLAHDGPAAAAAAAAAALAVASAAVAAGAAGSLPTLAVSPPPRCEAVVEHLSKASLLPTSLPRVPASLTQDSDFAVVGTGRIYVFELLVLAVVLPEPLDSRHYCSVMECGNAVSKSYEALSTKPLRIVAGGDVPNVFVRVLVVPKDHGHLLPASNRHRTAGDACGDLEFEAALPLLDIFERVSNGGCGDVELRLLPSGSHATLEAIHRHCSAFEENGDAGAGGPAAARVRIGFSLSGQEVDSKLRSSDRGLHGTPSSALEASTASSTQRSTLGAAAASKSSGAQNPRDLSDAGSSPAATRLACCSLKEEPGYPHLPGPGSDDHVPPSSGQADSEATEAELADGSATNKSATEVGSDLERIRRELRSAGELERLRRELGAYAVGAATQACDLDRERRERARTSAGTDGLGTEVSLCSRTTVHVKSPPGRPRPSSPRRENSSRTGDKDDESEHSGSEDYCTMDVSRTRSPRKQDRGSTEPETGAAATVSSRFEWAAVLAGNGATSSQGSTAASLRERAAGSNGGANGSASTGASGGDSWDPQTQPSAPRAERQPEQPPTVLLVQPPAGSPQKPHMSLPPCPEGWPRASRVVVETDEEVKRRLQKLREGAAHDSPSKDASDSPETFFIGTYPRPTQEEAALQSAAAAVAAATGTAREPRESEGLVAAIRTRDLRIAELEEELEAARRGASTASGPSSSIAKIAADAAAETAVAPHTAEAAAAAEAALACPRGCEGVRFASDVGVTDFGRRSTDEPITEVITDPRSSCGSLGGSKAEAVVGAGCGQDDAATATGQPQVFRIHTSSQ